MSPLRIGGNIMKKIITIIVTILVITSVTGCQLQEETSAFASSEPLDNNFVVSHIEYQVDGLMIQGYEARPIDTEQKYPLIIYNRGGNRDFGAIEDQMAINLFGALAKQGYVVLASQYRGYNDVGIDQFGGDDLKDIHSLIDLAYEIDYIDTDQIYMIGMSRGGMMTYMILRERNDIKAAAVIGGVTDLVSTYEDRDQGMKTVLEELIGGSPSEMPEAYEARSAIHFSEMLTEPLLILHGGEDWRVASTQATELATLLEENGNPHKLIVYKGDDHGLSNHQSDYFYEILDWFSQH